MSYTDPPDSLGRDPQPLLARALLGNAAFSGVSGGLLALNAPLSADFLGVHPVTVLVVGVALVGFAVMLATGALHTPLLRPVGRAAVTADVVWIVVAVPIVALGDVLTAAGSVSLAGVTAIVAVLALAQWRGLRRISRRPAVTP